MPHKPTAARTARALSSILSIATAHAAHAATRTFLSTAAGTYAWSADANWSPAGAPANNDDVNISSTSIVGPTTLLMDAAYTPDTHPGYITFNSPNVTIRQTAPGSALQATRLSINGDGGNTTYVQSAGANTLNLTLGENFLSTGTYSLSGTASLSSGYQMIYSGSVVQTGGTNSTSDLAFFGSALTPSARYSLSGTGTLLSQYASLGYATFAQSGGTHSASQSLVVGGYNSAGLYSLSGGSLSTPTLRIGDPRGGGSFAQSGGSNAVSSLLQINGGAYTLSGGSLSATSISVAPFSGFTQTAGSLSFSTFTQTGGVASFPTLAIPATATYALRGGTLTVTSLNTAASPSRLNWTAGTLNLTSPLVIDTGQSALGASYSLSNSAQTLKSPNLYVGQVGTGAFTQSAGTNLVSSTLYLGASPGATGSYSLTGGSLSATSVVVGPNSSLAQTGGTLSFRTLTQSGGSVSLPSLSLAPASSYTLAGGSLFLPAPPSLPASSTFNQSAGTLLIDYTTASPADAIRSLIRTGYATGSWNGAGGIASSSAAASSSSSSSPSSPPQSLAYTEAAPVLHLTGGQTATYAGQTIDASSLLVFLTTTGDATLDGRVDGDDYALLDRSLAKHHTNAHWTDGDFNYDGQVDVLDYLLIDRTLGQVEGFSPGVLAQRESQFGPAYVEALITSIPEPASPLACLFAEFLLCRRRNRTKTHAFRG